MGSYGQTSCEACPSGYHQDKPGAAFCLPCTPGRYNDDVSQAVCLECAIGRSSLLLNRTNECDLCSPGNRQPEKGTTACLNCIPGRYQDEEQQKICKNCAFGQASSNATRKTECDSCIPGRYQDQQEQKDCNACPAGWAALQSGVGCTSCTFGQYRSADDQVRFYCSFQCHLNFWTNFPPFLCTLTCYCNIEIKGIGLHALPNWFRQ